MEKSDFKLSNKKKRKKKNEVATEVAALGINVDKSEDENNNDEETILFQANISTCNRFEGLGNLAGDSSSQTVPASVNTSSANKNQSYTPTNTPPRKQVEIDKLVEAKVEKDRKSEVFKTMWQEYSDALDKHMDKHTAGIDSLCEKVSAWSEKL